MTNTIEPRQLKFKVWDDSNSNLGMSEPFELGECRAVFHRKLGGLRYINIDLSMRFLQLTGLKDCEGKGGGFRSSERVQLASCENQSVRGFSSNRKESARSGTERHVTANG